MPDPTLQSDYALLFMVFVDAYFYLFIYFFHVVFHLGTGLLVILSTRNREAVELTARK